MRSQRFTSSDAAESRIQRSQAPPCAVRLISNGPLPLTLAMKLLVAFVAWTLLLVAPARAVQQNGAQRSLSPEGLALGGYDPVSYFLLCVRSIVPWPGK